jgi:hypothetical protein
MNLFVILILHQPTTTTTRNQNRNQMASILSATNANIGESFTLRKKKTVKKPEPEPVAESDAESDDDAIGYELTIETRPCFRRCGGTEKPLKEFISKNGKMRKMCNSCSILECAASKKSKMKKKDLRDENSDEESE